MLLNFLLETARRPKGVAAAPPAPPPPPAPGETRSRIVRRAPVSRGGLSFGSNGQPRLPPTFVKDVLDRQDRIPSPARAGADDDGLIHVSSLIDACPRREVIATTMPEERFRNVHGHDRLVWAYGRAYEKHARDQFAAGWQGAVYGRWECRCGFRHFIGRRPHRDHVCQRCRLPMDVYQEHPIRCEELGLKGNCDLPVLLDDNWLMVGEFKSMEGEAWKALEAPLGDHIAQAGTYRELYRRAGWKVHDTIAIVYGSKHYRWGSPYKDFYVDGTSQSVQSIVTALLDKAAEAKRHREAGTLPPRTCSSASSGRAKQCVTCSQCWTL